MTNKKPADLEELRQKVLRQQLKKRMHSSQEAAVKQMVVKPVSRDEKLLLSWPQQRLWFLDQLDPQASAAYYMTTGLRLQGKIEFAVLQQTLNHLVARHESLRTSFSSVAGEPVQNIGATDSGFLLQRLDLSDSAPGDNEARLQHYLENDVAIPFDMATGPMIRGRLLSLDENDHVLLINQHHIITDGWSVGVFAKELATLYNAFTQGQTDPLPALPVHYADYAMWQRQFLQGEELKRQQDYWYKNLNGAPALLELPSDRTRPAVQSYAGASVDFTLSEEVTTQLRAFSQRHDCTLFMTLMGAWSLLLSRLSGQDDVVVGTPVANRQRAELEGLIGFFANTLVLRVKLQDCSVSQYLAQMKTTVLAAFDHQDMPFEQIVELLKPERSMSYSPIFQSTFSWHNTPQGGEVALPGLHISSLETATSHTQADLSLHLSDLGNNLGGQVVFASDLYDSDTIKRWMEHFETVLSSMIDDEKQMIADISLLNDSQRKQVLQDFNQTDKAGDNAGFIHQHFESLAKQQPDAIALDFEGEQLSYGELNDQANQLAHYLVTLGVTPDARVALCVERGLEMVVGLLAVLKAGGAYVPIDPSYPEERLAYLLEDSEPVVILTQADLEEYLPYIGAPVVRLDVDMQIIALQGEKGNLAVDSLGLTPQNLAYVIYTSGSTGTPKGVMVEHHNLVASTQSRLDVYGRSDSFLLLSSVAFDSSIVGIFWTMLSGGTLYISDAKLAPEVLSELIQEHQISSLLSVPSLLTELFKFFAQQPATSLQHIISAGEACPLNLDKQAWSVAPNAEFYNEYGPTEATVWASYYKSEVSLPGRLLPIGRPINNTRVYILDKQLQPVPLGVSGELYIAGAGVARGYLNQDELTEQRFIADPFSLDDQQRMYKTGDLGRWLADGNIDYLGRNDFQVKLRGFRIELGEIETRLLDCYGVAETQVMVREDVPGDQRLVAYIVMDEELELDIEELRNDLAEVLPEYMVPNAYVALEQFPLNANGKVDRQALPAPGGDAVLKRDYQAPQGEIEIAIAAVWQDMLAIEQVGRQDHFFELGGHSLMAVSVIERLRQQQMNVDVRAIFSNPVLSELAQVISENAEQTSSVAVSDNLILENCQHITPELLPLVSLQQSEIDTLVAEVDGGVGNVQDIYPLTSAQEGMLFHHLLENEVDVYQGFWLLGFEERLSLDKFLSALQSVINRHDILRTSFHWQGVAKPVQVVNRQAQMPVIERTLQPGQDAVKQLQAMLDPAVLQLDLSDAPLLRAYIAKDPESQRWLLSLNHHHMIEDNFSLQIILYETQLFLLGREQELSPALPLRNFIAQSLAIPEAEHVDYFTRRLGDIETPTAPFDVLNIQGDGREVNEHILKLDDDLGLNIRACARQYGVNASVIFHLAWSRVLSRLTGRDDVVFGTVLSGRMDGSEGIDRVLGMFINTLPVRISQGGVSVKQAVKQTYDDFVEILRHEQASLSLAQRCSGVDKSLPLFTSLLNYRNVVSNTTVEDDEVEYAFDNISVYDAQERTNYPITLSVDDAEDGFGFKIQCVEGIDGEQINAYLVHTVQALVSALQDEGDTALTGIDILSKSQRRQLLPATAPVSALADKVSGLDAELCLHQLFEQQVAANADAVAVTFEGQQLSYGELNARANQVANYLIAQGVKPDMLVGLCVERSLETVIGLLAILKAGGAYVPLDPSYPEERLNYIMSDSGISILLTQSHLVAQLPISDQQLISLDQQALFGAYPNTSPEMSATGVDKENLAYVIYTSGSTGTPKGVLVSHHNVSRLFNASDFALKFSGDDVWTLFHSFAFDFSVWEIFGALLHGGKLVVVPYWTARSSEDFYQLVVKEQVTVLNQTPSAFGRFIAAGQQKTDKLALRYVVFGGEALNLESLVPWINRYGDNSPELVNMYGITETTVHVTYRRILAEDVKSCGGRSLIGRPLTDLASYVLTPDMNLAPQGVTGELYVSGGGVTRGYLNQAALTGQRFIDNPFAVDGHETLYRSGDLVRRLPCGELEYIGRIDDQVKIRGYRIELGEIEANLVKLANFNQGIVIARDEPKRLVAYVVPEKASVTADEQSAFIDTLRSALEQTLPEHMMPSAFVLLEQMPLTSHGKVDRKALPAPDALEQSSAQYIAPQTPIEQQLCAIWQTVLEVEKIGVLDNFFNVGGDSILSIQVVALAQQQQLHFSVKDLFTTRTVRELAELIALGETQAIDNLQVEPFELLTEAELKRLQALCEHNRIEDAYPLSALQQGMVFHNQLSQEQGTYHDVFGFRLSEQWDFDAFSRALHSLMTQNEMLRSILSYDGDRLLHVIYQQLELPLLVEDLRALSEEDQEKRLLNWHHEERVSSFDKDKPLWSVVIHHLSEQSFQYNLSFHHALLDGWSVASLNTMLFTLYREALEQQPLQQYQPLPYRHFIAHEQKVQDIAEVKEYWQQTLDADQLPSWTGAPKQSSIQSSVLLDAQQSQALQALAKAHGVQEKSILLTAHMVLLSLLNGQQTMTSSVVFNGRPEQMGSEKTLGLFLNSLPFTTNIANSNWQQLISGVDQQLLTVSQYRLYSLSNIMNETGLDFSGALFNYVNFHVYEQIQDQVELTGSQAFEETNYLYTLHCVKDGASGYTLNLTVDGVLFSGQWLERVQAYLVNIINAMLSDATASVTPALYMGSDEYQQSLTQWNKEVVELALPDLIHQQFEAIAGQYPDTPAVVYQDQSLSYQVLNEQANRLAHYLVSQGIKQEDLVALCLQRSTDMLVAVLGTLKAGAAYVPLDADYPDERLAYLLADSKPKLILTGSFAQRRSVLFAQPQCRAVLLDSEPVQQALNEQALSNPDLAMNKGNDLAYVIYTSGSTGQPKGVMVEHHSVLNLCEEIEVKAAHQLALGVKVGLNAALSFDASLQGIVQLLRARTLEVIPQSVRVDGAAFVDFIRERQIQAFDCTPVQLQEMLLAGLAEQCPGLKYVLVGGESITPALWQRLSGITKVKFYNAYGPTECTVNATLGQIQASSDVPHIGTPVLNNQVYILDSQRQPVPVGVVGEMYVGGQGVARGYLNQPELTAQRFIDNHFSYKPGERLYQTGDLARWCADGTIEYVGRNDFQVKIRGFRVELGEIETSLLSIEGINEAVVTIADDGATGKILVAYVVSEQGKVLAPREIRHALLARLPEHMVPAAFVLLDKLPLMVNGKLNRQALPEPGEEARIKQRYQAPQGQYEIIVARIWQQLLGAEQIGRHDNFFELGGHSLLAMKVISKLQQQLQLDCSVGMLFSQPVLSEFANTLTAQVGEGASNLIPMRSTGNQRPLFFVHAGDGEVVYASNVTPLLDPEVPVYAFSAEGLSEGQLVQASIETMASRYIELIRQVQPQGPYRIAGWSVGGLIAYEMAYQLIGLGQEVELLALIDTAAQMDIRADGSSSRRLYNQSNEVATYILDHVMTDISAEFSDKLHAFNADENITGMIQLCQQYDLLPPDLSPALLQRYLATRAGILKAAVNYQPKDLPVPLQLLTATEDEGRDLPAQWQALSGEQITVYPVEGDHESMVEHPQFAQALEEALLSCSNPDKQASVSGLMPGQETEQSLES